MADLIDRDAAHNAIGFERCDRSCTDCPTKCTWYYTVKNIPAVNRWISCSERLPEQTGYYLVCDSAAEFDNIRGRQEVAKFVIGRHGGHWYGTIRRECITHYMPLPEPPEKEDEGGTISKERFAEIMGAKMDGGAKNGNGR